MLLFIEWKVNISEACKRHGVMSRKRCLDGNLTLDSIVETPNNSDNKDNSEITTEKPKFIFKNPNFKHSNIVGNKKKPWKTLKQILAAEQSLAWPEAAITYSSLEAPPSFRGCSLITSFQNWHKLWHNMMLYT